MSLGASLWPLLLSAIVYGLCCGSVVVKMICSCKDLLYLPAWSCFMELGRLVNAALRRVCLLALFDSWQSPFSPKNYLRYYFYSVLVGWLERLQLSEFAEEERYKEKHVDPPFCANWLIHGQ